MTAKVKAEDMPAEVLEKVGLKPDNGKNRKMVKPQTVALGAVLVSLKGLSKREALWVLKIATVLVRGYRKEKKNNPNTTVQGRKGAE